MRLELIPVVVTVYCICLTNADLLESLRAHRDKGSLPLQFNDTEGSLTSNDLAKKFALNPNSWRDVAEGVDLIGWYTKENKVSSGEGALTDAMRKFYSVVGLEYDTNKQRLRKGPVYTVKNGETSMNFCIGEAIGKGSYGEVRIAEESTTGELYAMKTELQSVDPTEKVLKCEYECYQVLRRNGINTGIPYVVPNSSGVWRERDVMIMELLGTNLEELFLICGKQFSAKTLLTVLLQMGSSLEQMHKLGYLHRDIKPENCMIGNVLGHNGLESSKFVKLVDLGFGTKYIDEDGNFLPMEYVQAGTETYMSRDVFAKLFPKPKDDIETLSYVMLYLWLGYMPFVVSRDKDESDEKLCKNCPKQLLDYLVDARRPMREDEMPNYDLQKSLLLDLFQKKGLSDDKNFDWERKLSLLLRDPEVNRVGVGSEKVTTEDGIFWISVFLVGKFYVDTFAHMNELREGLQKLRIDSEATSIAKEIAHDWIPGSTNPEVPNGNAMIVTSKSTDLDDLLKAFHAKYPTELGTESFVGIVTNSDKFFVGFGCRYNEEEDIYTFVVVLTKLWITTATSTYFFDNNLMRAAHLHVAGSNKTMDDYPEKTVTELLEKDFPPESVPVKDAILDALQECWTNYKKNKLQGNVMFPGGMGYAYNLDTVKDKLVVAITTLCPQPRQMDERRIPPKIARVKTIEQNATFMSMETEIHVEFEKTSVSMETTVSVERTIATEFSAA